LTVCTAASAPPPTWWSSRLPAARARARSNGAAAAEWWNVVLGLSQHSLQLRSWGFLCVHTCDAYGSLLLAVTGCHQDWVNYRLLYVEKGACCARSESGKILLCRSMCASECNDIMQQLHQMSYITSREKYSAVL
jgi:hypothetical protein